MSLIVPDEDFDIDAPIGRAFLKRGDRSSISVDRELLSGTERPNVVRGGSLDGLAFAFVWKEGSLAELKLLVGGRIVWGAEPFLVDLSQLLISLSNNWNFLLFEENYPLGIVPIRPSWMASEAARTITPSDDEAEAEAEAEAIRQFEDVHNLGKWVTGGAPTLWAVRQANEMVLDTEVHLISWSFFDVVRTLTSLGDAIAERFRRNGICDAVVSSWERREKAANDDEALSIALGRPLQETQYLIEKGIVRAPSRTSLLRGLDDLQVAARMLGAYVDMEDLATVAGAIEAIPRINSSHLDVVSREAKIELKAVAQHLPYEQGQHLARWLRARLDCNNLGLAIDPRVFLYEWGIPVDWIMLEANIEAVSIWSAQHGPAVLINRDGNRSRKNPNHQALGGGARATLAHEICHLLVDRGRSLPILEVFGGSTPRVLEQRAGAFAAELLLPMEWAIYSYRVTATVQMALQQLTKTYQVTNSLAALQILNGFKTNNQWICKPDEIYLRHIVRRW